MLKLHRATGLDRRFLAGVVLGMGLPTYEGPRNAKAIDDEGKAAVLCLLREAREGDED